MDNRKTSLRNLPFFEAYATTSELPESQERSALEAEYFAAILVLRLFTDWVDCPAVLIGTPDKVSRLQVVVDGVPDQGVQQLFSTILGQINRSCPEPSAVAAPLLSYVWILEETGRHVLAADVLHTVLDALAEHGNPLDDPTLAAIYRRLGTNALRYQTPDEAEAYHQQQFAIAKRIGDKALILDARIQLSGVQYRRGNLGTADTLLTAIINEASAAGAQRQEALARRLHGSTLHQQGKVAEALREYYTAYTCALDWLQHEWLLNDIAVCALELGLRDFAHLVFTALAQTAHHSTGRLLALRNLLEIAVLDKDQDTFNNIWQQLDVDSMQIEYRLQAQMVAAMAAAQWHSVEAGMDAYQTVAARARQIGFHEVEFRSLAAIDALRHSLEDKNATHATASLSTLPTSPIEPAVTVSNDPEWEEISQTIGDACRLRLQAAGLA